MGWFSNIGNAILSCISKPIDVLCDWASEPLKNRDYERDESSKKAAHQRNIDTLTAQSRVEHELKSKEIELEHKLRSQDKEFEVELEIRRVHEIEKSAAEIQEWKKEKEFARMERTTAAIALYLEQLTKLNVETINAIGQMQLELKERAQKLVYEKAIQYKELQDKAIEDAMNDFCRIEEKFGNNERAQNILIQAVDAKLGNIITTSTRFLDELNRDIINLNKSIDRLTIQGQRFIENHLEHFYISTINLRQDVIDNDNGRLPPPHKEND
ncbi:hypothetical protein WKE96_13610 [Edwardsiella tarda]|uniref:hypothetical protein n=1 Tax=Edwardsiella tarda TaxID=636 RepID=UPI0039BE964D